MRVAIPLFGDDVAPRFGFASSFLIADVEDGQVTAVTRYATRAVSWLERIQELCRLDVNVILCCGYDQRFVPLAQSKGINVQTGVWGDARRAVEALAAEGPRRCRKRRRRGKRGGAAWSAGANNRNKDKR
jgi:predicted Fe-Mo cluster-binding NifX family protein